MILADNLLKSLGTVLPSKDFIFSFFHHFLNHNHLNSQDNINISTPETKMVLPQPPSFPTAFKPPSGWCLFVWLSLH
jgi:hypothetical protein